MQVITYKTGQILWLLLLVVFVLCAGLSSPVGWAADLQQEIELVTEEVADPSEGNKTTTGFIACLAASEHSPYFSILPKSLPSVSGSDAYPSLILHGPPTPNNPV